MNVSTIPAYIARTQFGALLNETAARRHRFIITKTGVPTAVLMSVSDFDDMVEELDPEFQKSLQTAHREYKAEHAITLQEYMANISRQAA